MKQIILFLAVFFLLPVTQASAAENSTKQLVYGAGPSTQIVQLFFAEFEKTPSRGNYTFEIPPKSVKHAGGVKSSEKYLFGRTGRPLNEQEKSMNKGEILLGQVPIVIAVGSGTGVTALDMGQLEKIITGQYTNWKEVGGADAPITTVGREDKEALYSILKIKYPFFASAKFTQIFTKDDEVVAFLENPRGKHSIAFGAAPNFKDREGIDLPAVAGFVAGQQLGLVYDLSNQNLPIVKSVAEYACSSEWTATVSANGYLPANE